MIRSFRDSEIAALFARRPLLRLPRDIERVALRKLVMLDAAETITEESVMRRLPPIHPGEVLLEEFLKPLGITQYRLAKDLSVPARRINEIVHGTRGVTADTALRLARHFGTSDRFWLNLQAGYDLAIAKDNLGRRLEQEVVVLRQTA